MTALVKYEAARSALAEARTVDEVKDIRDKAEAIRAYARMAKDKQLEIDATEIRARATRRIGEFMAEQPKAPAGRKPKIGLDKNPITLADAGIDKNLAHAARQLAGMPEEDFEETLSAWREHVSAENERVTLNTLSTETREKRQQHRRDLEQRLSDASESLLRYRQFPNIYADPATKFVSGFGDRSIENHYVTMTTEQLCALPVKARALPDARLFIWSTVPQLANTFKIAEAWGFPDYSSHMVWDKTSPDHPTHGGTGHVFINQHELLLYFKRGNPAGPTRGKQALSIYREAKREHSRKPDYFRDMINEFTAHQDVLELFARVDADHPLPSNFTPWGNEAEQPTENTTVLPDVVSAPAPIPPAPLGAGAPVLEVENIPEFLQR
jgi:N6-adenosine-specific RNA methylase IME4